METKVMKGLTMKSAEPGRFAGKASVYGVVDYQGDIVMPGAFTKSLAHNRNQIKVLAQHNPDDVIGLATLTDSPDALLADGKLVLDLPSAKDMYTRLTNKLIDGISIGYQTERATYNRDGNRLLHEVSLFEISLVTFPANDAARVSSVKAAQAEAAGIAVISALSSITSQLKRGRVFSANNESTLRDVHASIEAVREKVLALLSQLDETA